MSNRHLVFGLLAASIAACPALKATAQEVSAKAPPGNTVIATPSLSGTPGELVVNANDTFVYATVDGSTIAVIDTSNNTVTQNWSLGSGVELFGLAIAPNGKDLYAGVEISGAESTYGVDVVDTTSGSVTKTIPLNGIPFLLSVSPDGKLVYVPTNTGELIGLTTINEPGSVVVIDTKTKKVTHTIPVGGTAYSVTFNSNGGLAYVSNPLNASVSVINTATSKVTHTILVGGYDLFVTLNAATNDVFALLFSPTSLETGGTGLEVIKGDKLIKSVTPPATDTIGVPGFTPNGRYAYVPVSAVDGSPANFVYLMDTTNYKPVGTNIPVGNGPEFVAIAHNGKYAYVANETDGTVSVIQISPAQ